MIKVAIVILNWNGEQFLKKFLPTVIRCSASDDVEIIVADNGSTDRSLALLTRDFPQVKQIDLEENYGFAKGYNVAIEQVKAEYLVLLNSDVAVTPRWLEAPIAYLDRHEDVIACQPKILQEAHPLYFEFAGAAGGYIDTLGYPYCRGRILDVIEEDKGQYDTVKEIFWASGACFFIKRADYISYGGLDDSFFAHQEEIDLCWRINASGKKLVCVPQSVVYHVGGGTLQKESPFKTYLNFRNNLLMLYKNLPIEVLFQVLFMRFFLDYLAALVFLFKGNYRSAIAVVKARAAFWRMRSSMKEKRAFNMSRTIEKKYSRGIYSILIHYYLRGRSLFSQLPANKS